MNTSDNYEITYPRLNFRRKAINLFARGLLRLLARPTVSGLENIPAEGPVILAGNHVSTLEPLLMAVYPKRLVELVGAGDMPFEGLIDQLVDYYGFIPINRGILDRDAMNKALGILKQGGVLGIYPEGGTWNPGRMKAQVGVAWLSHKGQAPVVPIGFSGFRNGLARALKLKRPKIEMRVGTPIPALQVENDDRPIKDVYQEYADLVLERIKTLVDPADVILVPVQSDYELRAGIENENGSVEEAQIVGSDALAEMLFMPVMLDSLAVNLKKPVQPLYPTEQHRQNQQFSKALTGVFEVLAVNPGFLTYRLGFERGRQAENAMRDLLQMLERVQKSGKTIILDASTKSRFADGRVEEKSQQYRILPD